MLIQHAPQKHSPNATSHALADAWLKKNGNGMDRMPKEKQKKDGYWKLFGKIPTRTLVKDYFNHYDMLVPSELADQSCYQNVSNMCTKLVKSGDLVKVMVSKGNNDPMRDGRTKRVIAYKRA